MGCGNHDSDSVGDQCVTQSQRLFDIFRSIINASKAMTVNINRID
jgi:hypothetical protein